VALDRREMLLARLVGIAQSIPGIKSVYRNQAQISERQRPAIVVIDGHEEGALGSFALGRPLASPGIMRLLPEIYIMVGTSAAAIGSDINAFRLALLPAVLTDPELQDLIGTTGGIEYQGCVTDLGRGETTEGFMQLHFALHYALKLSEISEG
jgi:hypothetical protein